MADSVPVPWLPHARAHFEAIRARAERALAQVSDAAFHRTIDPESNSLATLVKHLAGNMLSRWTDFLTTDGEKPTRRRDAEFVREPGDSRETLMRRWEEGWRALFDALAALGPGDLGRTVTVRGEPHTVFEAIERQKEHYAHHAGQIVLIAKHWAGPRWTTLSIAKGASATYRPPPRP